MIYADVIWALGNHFITLYALINLAKTGKNTEGGVDLGSSPKYSTTEWYTSCRDTQSCRSYYSLLFRNDFTQNWTHLHLCSFAVFDHRVQQTAVTGHEVCEDSAVFLLEIFLTNHLYSLLQRSNICEDAVQRDWEKHAGQGINIQLSFSRCFQQFGIWPYNL